MDVNDQPQVRTAFPRGKILQYQSILEGSVGPRASVDVLEKAYLFSLPEFEPRILQPVNYPLYQLRYPGFQKLHNSSVPQYQQKSPLNFVMSYARM